MRSSRTFRALLFSLAAAFLAPSASAQTFAQPTVVPTGNWPVAVYTADVNNDGFPDLIYIDAGATPQASTTHVLLNDGHGHFTQSATLPTAGSSLAIGDLTGSGHVDLGWFVQTIDPVGVTEYLHIAAGRGDGTFAANANYGGIGQFSSKPFQFIDLLAGRMHDSGALDIVAQEPNNNVVYLIRANPTLHSLQSVSLGSLPDGTGTATVLDLNHDGHGDLVVDAANGASAQIFLGNGNGLPQTSPTPVTPSTRFTGTSGVHSLLVQDVNYDGIPDLIVEGAAGHIDVFPGNGDGTFQSTSIGGTGPLDGTTGNGGHLIVAADLNNDNLLDALTITPAGLSTLLGQGTQYLGLKGIFNAGPTGTSGHPSYVTADFNHDGFLDLAVDSPEGIAMLFGVGDGTFQTSRAFAAGRPAMSSVLGAFTASGHTDAAVSISSTTAQLLFGQGDGTFLAAPTPALTQTANPPLWGILSATDINSDGKLDLVVTADGPAAALPALGYGITVGFGQGDGTFTIPSLLNTHANPGGITFFGTSVASPALGPSGTPGLAVLDQQHLWDIYNAPSGLTSTAIATLSDPHAHNLIAAGSLHGGTLPDLIVEDEGSLKLYLNSPTGFAAIPAGDLAIDGSLTTPGRAVAPALSSTFGGTVPKSSGGLGFPAAIGSMVIADLDRDGNNDLLVAYDNMGADHTAPNQNTAPNYIYIWYGSGGGKFLATARHPINPLILTPARNNYQLAVADINGDKIPDLIMCDGYVITVAYGVGDGTFGAEKHFLGGQGINTISAGDVNGDGIPDLILANGGAVLTNPVASHETLAINPGVDTGGITVLLNQTPQAPPLVPTSLALALCVDDPGSLFPCGNPLSATPLVSPVTMYFGQVLDGVAVESATNLTGTITFYDGTRVFCTIPANLTGVGPTGNACPTNAGNFHAGNRTVDAVYSGDSANAPSTSNSIQVNVFPDITASTIASSLNPATVGQAVTFTATITGNFAIPTGFVTFFDGLNQIGTGTLDASGSATYTTSTLAVGSHPITVSYAGTPDFNPAPIAILTQVIVPPATPPPPPPPPPPTPTPTPGTFTLTVAPSLITIPVGRTGLLVVTVTANGTFAQPVALTCSTTTPETSCDFILPTIPAGAGSTTFELHTSAPHNCGDPNHPYFLGSCTPPPASPSTHPGWSLSPRAAAIVLPGLLLFGLGFSKTRRRLRHHMNDRALTLLFLFTLAGLTTLSGCGVCTDLGTQGGRYTFTITATAQGTPVTETQSQIIPLTVIIP